MMELLGKMPRKVSQYITGNDTWMFACFYSFFCQNCNINVLEVMTRIFGASTAHYPLSPCSTGDYIRWPFSICNLVKQIAIGAARSKDYFDRHGDLKRIRRLKYCPLDRFLVDKFKFSATDAREFAEFLTPLLDFAPEKRPTAQQCLQHPWLNVTNLTQKEVKTETSLGKMEVGMGKLQIKVGKWGRVEGFVHNPSSTCMITACDFSFLYSVCWFYKVF